MQLVLILYKLAAVHTVYTVARLAQRFPLQIVKVLPTSSNQRLLGEINTQNIEQTRGRKEIPANLIGQP